MPTPTRDTCAWPDDQAVHIGAARRRAKVTCSWQRHPRRRASATGAQAVHPGLRLPVRERQTSRRPAPTPGWCSSARRLRPLPRWAARAAAKSLMEKRRRAAGARATTGSDNDPALLAREAERIGYPVLIKASAGGGGKGMRRVEKRGRLRRRAGQLPARGQGQRSATTMCWWSAMSRGRGTSRSRSSATAMATSSTWASATARCSAATRRCWRSRPRRA